MNILSISNRFEAKYAKFSLPLKSLRHVVKVLLYDISYVRPPPPCRGINASQEEACVGIRIKEEVSFFVKHGVLSRSLFCILRSPMLL